MESIPTSDILDAFFMQGGGQDCPNNLVRHQIESMNEFMDKQLLQIIQGFNPIQVCHNYSPELGEFKYKLFINIINPTMAKPVFQSTDGTQMLMTPHYARMNNLSYVSNLYVDVHVITNVINDDGVNERHEHTLTGICIGKIPIMIRSKACILTQMPGIADEHECRYDYGGYFLINGNEKVIISQDRISENKTLVFAPNSNGDGLYAEIRSMPDGVYLPPKTTSLHLSGKSNHQGNIIRLSASFIRTEIPLFIMFRALGIESDKDIYAHIVYDIDSKKNQRMIANLAASADDAYDIHTQHDALLYILKVMGSTGVPREYLDQPERAIAILQNIIRNDFLAHTGKSFRKKALYLGFMVNKILSIHLGYMDYDNRDSYLNKRIDTPGILFSNLFRQCYGKLIKEVRNLIVRELNLWRANPNMPQQLINQNNIHRFFKISIIETGLRYALSTGNWGVKTIGSFQNIRQGVAQVLNRMSYLSTLSHMRRINTPMEKNGKLIQPRKLENSQFGMICPSETPEGAAVGLVKNIALSTCITVNSSSVYVREVIATEGTHLYGDDVVGIFEFLKAMGSENAVHIMVNGDLVGYHTDPSTLYNKLKHLKRYGSIPAMTSIVWDVKRNIIMISTEAGRMCRPLHIVDNNSIRLESYPESFKNSLKNKQFQTFIAPITDESTEGFLEYMDVDEIDKAMVAMFSRDLKRGIKGTTLPPNFTHCEIYPALINGVLAANIPFMDHNQAPRNCYQCLDIHEPVTLVDGSTKQIKDVVAGDNVLCFDPVTKLITNTSVVHQYIRPALKPINRVFTLSGRHIIATNDHKFSTNQGWVDTVNFNANTKLAIYVAPQQVSTLTNTPYVINLVQLINTDQNVLAALNVPLFPLTTTNAFMPVIARLMGYINGNNTSGYPVNSVIDQNKFDDDVKLLGFTDGYRNSTFSHLMIVLNGSSSSWLNSNNCSPLVIREYISGYLGGVNSLVNPPTVLPANIMQLIKTITNTKTTVVANSATNINSNTVVEYFSYAYNLTLQMNSAIIYEYVLYTKNYGIVKSIQNDSHAYNYLLQPLPYSNKLLTQTEWTTIVTIQGHMLMVPVGPIQAMSNRLISDITVASTNHSFIGGDGFAVSNSAMGKQAVGIYTSNFNTRIDTMGHVLHYPQKPIVKTKLAQYTNSDSLPSGINAVVAIMTYSGFNQEDSVMINQSAIDRGLFTSSYYKSYRDMCSKNHSTGEEEVFTKPVIDTDGRVKPFNYEKLGEDGFVPKNTYVDMNDVCVGKVMPHKQHGVVTYRDTSTQIKGNDEGYIDQNYQSVNGDGYKFCKIKLRQYRKPVIGDKVACYDVHHEVLTTDGWVGIAEITTKHKVASIVNNALVYQNPSAIQSYDYKGEMITVKSNHVDLCVTPNHRMYYRPKYPGADFRVDMADKIYGKRHKFKKNVDIWQPDANDQDFSWHLKMNEDYTKCTHFRFEGYTDGNGVVYPDFEINIDAWLTMYGIYIAEGSVRKYSILIAANKPRVQAALDEASLISGIRITKNMSKGERVNWNIWCRYMTNHIGLGHIAIHKRLMDWVWCLDRDHSQKLVHAMCLGDGGQMENGTWRYYTSSTGLADDFQRLCLQAGFSCNKKLKEEKGHSHDGIAGTRQVTITCNADYWVLTIITAQNEPLVNKNMKTMPNQYGKIDFDGKVYCCTVPEGDGVIYVRRNGTPIWCGQSRSAQKGTIGMTYKQHDMPFSKSGITPDIIMNPHAVPSRMTIGQLMECIMGKAACHLGTYGDSTPFTDCSVEGIANILERSGYERYGNEVLYNGRTGHQIQTEIFIGPTYYQRLKHMVSDKMHCLTMDHEVLTQDGWKQFKDITMDTKVATLNPTTHELEYNKPLQLHHYPDFNGKMYHISNQAIDLDVTINHRMLVSKCNTRKRIWNDYTLIKAEEIVGKHVKYLKSCKWTAPDYQFVLPGIENHEPLILDMDAWLTFFGIWIAEGWAYEYTKNNKNYIIKRVQICNCKQRVKDALYPALTLMGFAYNLHADKLTCTNKQLYSYMKPLSVGATNKSLPEWVWQLSSTQCQKLIYAMQLGDGSFFKNGPTVYYTSSIQLADDVMRLCIHAGWAGNKRLHQEAGHTTYLKDGRVITANNDLYKISIITKRVEPQVNHAHHKTQKIQNEYTYDYTGAVYCLSVPNEIFMVRKNGLSVWTGNSRGSSGPLVSLTRQPAEGRARNGGLRFGEMERDAIVAHGASVFLKERMIDVSDHFKCFICNKCGLICTANPERNIYKCNNCKNNAEISQIRIPYAMKLLMQELMSMSVAPRITV